MFLRSILKLGLRFLGGLLILGTIVLFVVGHTGPAIIFLSWAFIFFLIGWFYDRLLLWLNPENTVLILEN